MKKLLVITGPTATGKTESAIRVAEEVGGSVVSADSRQVYASMNIGTAKPKFAWSDKAMDEAAAVPSQKISHYLFNIRYPNQSLSLSEWQTMAFRIIDQVSSPILAGGTMLYIDSIIKNYDLPDVPANEELRRELEAQPAETLYTELLQKDPTASSFIQPHNKRRIIRALEVMAATGKPFSEQRRQRPARYDIATIGLFDSWEALEERIRIRIAAMFADGLVAETQKLIETYGADLPLLQTMNYRETVMLLKSEIPEKEAQREMLRSNLRYARRQMSWWRGRHDIEWYSPLDYAGIKKRLLQS